MCQELQIFAFVYMYLDASCLFRLCGSDFGITPVDDDNNINNIDNISDIIIIIIIF